MDVADTLALVLTKEPDYGTLRSNTLPSMTRPCVGDSVLASTLSGAEIRNG